MTCANDVPLETVANRSVAIGCGPDVDQARPLAGAAALRVADLGWQGRPRRLPRQASPAWAIALLGGALAGSGPGTSPYIDGLSLVTGMVVPHHAACSNHGDARARRCASARLARTHGQEGGANMASVSSRTFEDVKVGVRVKI